MLEKDLNKIIFYLYRNKKYINNEIVYLSKLSLIYIKYILDAYYIFQNKNRLTNINYKKHNLFKTTILEEESLTDLELELWSNNERSFLEKYLKEFKIHDYTLNFLIEYLISLKPWELNSLMLCKLIGINNKLNITNDILIKDGNIIYLEIITKYNLYS